MATALAGTVARRKDCVVVWVIGVVVVVGGE